MRSVLSHGADSYNLFFYPINDGKGTCCKIIPRFYASPYLLAIRSHKSMIPILLNGKQRDLKALSMAVFYIKMSKKAFAGLNDFF